MLRYLIAGIGSKQEKNHTMDMMEMLYLKLLKILILYEAVILFKYSSDHSCVNAADSCEASRQTVFRVNKCPENEAQWIAAAQRKNCSSLAGLCSEPDRFVYHCILNFFLNETLEVCAYGRRIFLGMCTEYSILGNLIQESRVECKMFPRPCPVIYPSTEAYKYQGCYNLVQRPTTSQPLTTRHSFLSTTGLHFVGKEASEGIPLTTSSGDFSTSDNMTEWSGSKDSAPCCGIVVIVSLILSLTILVIFLVVYFWRKRKNYYRKKGLSFELNLKDKNDPDTNDIRVPGPVMKSSSEEIEALLYPSGELLKSDFKKIEVHQEEESQVAKVHENQPKKNVKSWLEQLDEVVKKFIATKSVEDPEDESHFSKKLKHLYQSDKKFSDEEIPFLQECIQEVLEVNSYFEKKKHRTKNVKPI